MKLYSFPGFMLKPFVRLPSCAIGCVVLAGSACIAQGVEPILLLREGAPTSLGPVRGINGPTTNVLGGWATTISTGSDPRPVAVFGKKHTGEPADTLFSAADVKSARVTSIEHRCVLADDGKLLTSPLLALGNCSPLKGPSHGFVDSLFVDDKIRLNEWRAVREPTGKAWSYMSPVGMLSGGRIAWVGGQFASTTSMITSGNGLYLDRPGGAGFDVLVDSGSEIEELAELGVSLRSGRSVRLAAVAPEGESYIASVLLTGPANRNELIVQGVQGNTYRPDPYFATSMIRKGSAVAGIGSVSGEKWKSFDSVGSSSDGWYVAGTSETKNDTYSLILVSSEGTQAVALRSGMPLGQIVARGPFSSVAMNADADIAVVCETTSNLKALVLNRVPILVQGASVPIALGPDGQVLRRGTLTNFLGQNAVAITRRSPDRTVSVFVVANVKPLGPDPDPGVVTDDRIECLFRLDVRPSTTALCNADFNQSGEVSVQDLFDFLAAWFAIDPRADFNGNGSVSVQDIFDFLTAWFAGCS